MSRSRVVLTGIPAVGRHGADPGERLQGQEFAVDLDVTLRVDTGTDALEATVDYRRIVEEAGRVVSGTSFQLLETLADAVARAVYAMEGVMGVTAVVHKPRAAESMGVDDVFAEATIP